MADVAFDHITEDIRGTIYPGKLRLKEDNFLFKNEKTGKVDHFSGSDIVSAQWISRATGLGLRIKLKNDTVHRYDGFGELESDKVASFFQNYFNIEIKRRELCYKGFNWGEVEFDGDVMEFSFKNLLAFEVPLRNVANASVNKNELVFEFHPNDNTEVCLSEMRLYTPGTEVDREGKASLIYSKVTGEFLIEFKQLQCLQPRGRYDIKVYPNFIHLHGKSFDYKVPKNTITRLMMLPHPDNRSTFFAVQLDPPIKHGQTRYHFVILLFDKDAHVDLELSATEEWLQNHFNGKLSRNVSGPECEVVAQIFKVLFDQKVTVPGNFLSKGGGCSVSCSYKASVGLLYPLERGFIFVPRPPISIRFEEILSVQFSRGTGTQRSFDFEVETRNGLTHTFTSIERDEYHHLCNFVTSKKLRVKNINDDKTSVTLEDVWSSSDESHDVYMEKVKNEALQRSMVEDEDDDEDDEDFKPPDSDGSELAEEYDSNVSTTSSEDNSDEDGNENNDIENEGNMHTTSTVKRTKTHSDKRLQNTEKSKLSPPNKKKKTKVVKNSAAPSRPPSAYILWFNENRLKILKDLGGTGSVTDVAKAAGGIWRNMSDEEKKIYQSMAEEKKQKYMEELSVYQAKVATGEIKPLEISKKKSKTVDSIKSPHKSVPKSSFKSDEYVASSESSCDSDGSDKHQNLSSRSGSLTELDVSD